MITVNGKYFITLNEPIYVNDKSVIQVYANNILAYPDEYPASIKIINNPTKTQYTSGERIDLTGISVQAYKADGSVWQNSKYLNGIIPLSELICDPTVAHAKPSDFEYAGEEVKEGFGSILCTSEESEIVFVKYNPWVNNGEIIEYQLAQRWKLKFKPTGGGCYSILYKKTGWWLTTCLTQCVKIGEFDETAYPLEISWECEFLISPGYTDGSERGTKQLGYLETRPYYYDLASGWYERSDFYDGNDSIDYSYCSSISCTHIPYTHILRPANSLNLETINDRYYIESSTAPIVYHNTNYIGSVEATRVMSDYWGRRLTSGMRNSLSNVTVKWKRPGDGQELTTDFNIVISSAVSAQ